MIDWPFEGKYRDASVNHDYECCVQERPWQDVHHMFYDGMRANDEEPWRAKLMYFSVFFFGPRWPRPEKPPDRGFVEGDVARAADLFLNEPEITLEDVEALKSSDLQTRSPEIPSHIKGSKLLDDTKKIRAVTRTGLCLEPSAS